MKKWHLESIIIRDQVRKLTLPDSKYSMFQNIDKEMSDPSCKRLGLITCFRQKMLGYLKKGARAN